MEIQEIDVTIGPDGKVEMHVQGVKGHKCLAITKDLEKAFGGVPVSREMTSEALEMENPIEQRQDIGNQ